MDRIIRQGWEESGNRKKIEILIGLSEVRLIGGVKNGKR